MSELKAAQALEEEKKRRMEEDAEGSETEAETVIEAGDTGPGSKEVEVLEKTGELKGRGDRGSGSKSETEASTEDEWERVSENEKDK